MFSADSLLLIIGGTIVIFSWLFFINDKLAKFFFLFFVLMYLLYSGIGGALEGTGSEYQNYYFIYSIAISFGIWVGLKIITEPERDSKYLSWNSFLDYFMNKYAKKIIIFYLLLQLLSLIYPEVKLINLIRPPKPDVLSMLEERYNGDNQTTILSSLIYSLDQIIYPFFLLSLYKYRKSTVKLCLIVLLKYYIDYCTNSYLGRGDMLTGLIIVSAFTFFHRPKLGKILLVISLIVLPSLMVFFVKYSMIRIGGTAIDYSYADALEILFTQEGSYPLHFKKLLWASDNNYWFNYIIWLFTMPLPGFFRGSLDCNFNAIISEYLLNTHRGNYGFFILLPGMVGESVFLLGKTFFWINGVIYGLLMSITYRILTRYQQLFGILVACAICFSFTMNRGGLSSGIPFILKILVYFYLILWYMKQRNRIKLKSMVQRRCL